jgi:hypothetical protein
MRGTSSQGERFVRPHPQEFSALCLAFQQIATRTWTRIGNNHTTPISVREDGITALNLQDLYLLQLKEFTVFDFTPQVESSTTGADWEWWFMQPGKYFGAAVQAKALTTDQKYDIAYVPKNGYPQIRRLLDYSKNKGLAPMYCFYNWWRMPPARHWPCQSFVEHEDLWGCALADGFNVWKLHLRQKYSLADLNKYTMPWHCIACCPGHVDGGPRGPSTRALGIARVLRDQSPTDEPSGYAYEQDDYPEFPEPRIVEELPERITILRRYAESHERIGRDLILELFGETPPRKVILQGKPEKE